MPIYEFYCRSCDTIYKFLSRTVDTEKRPPCPKCGDLDLKRVPSLFAPISGSREEDDPAGLPAFDEEKAERAMSVLAREAEGMDEEDPRQAARLMRRLSDATGISLGPGMEEALHRLEQGEDPEKIEEEMGELLDEEDPFTLRPKERQWPKRERPRTDETLYEL